MRVAVFLVLMLAAAAADAQPFRGTKQPDVRYVPSPDSVVDAMLELARVTAGDVVYDLGSGDGRIPIAAAKHYGAFGVGIEIDAKLNRVAADNAKTAGVTDRVPDALTVPMPWLIVTEDALLVDHVNVEGWPAEIVAGEALSVALGCAPNSTSLENSWSHSSRLV